MTVKHVPAKCVCVYNSEVRELGCVWVSATFERVCRQHPQSVCVSVCVLEGGCPPIVLPFVRIAEQRSRELACAKGARRSLLLASRGGLVERFRAVVAPGASRPVQHQRSGGAGIDRLVVSGALDRPVCPRGFGLLARHGPWFSANEGFRASIPGILAHNLSRAVRTGKYAKETSDKHTYLFRKSKLKLLALPSLCCNLEAPFACGW